MAVRVSGERVPRKHLGGKLLSGRRLVADRADDRLRTAVCSQRVTSATMRKVGICTLARNAAAKRPAESRSGVMRKDTRSPGAMHLERLAAKYVRSGASEASGTALGSSAP